MTAPKIDSLYVQTHQVEESTPERRLWASVVLRTVRDFVDAAKNKYQHGMDVITNEVMSPGFQEICIMAGINYHAIKSFVKARKPIQIGAVEWMK